MVVPRRAVLTSVRSNYFSDLPNSIHHRCFSSTVQSTILIKANQERPAAEWSAQVAKRVAERNSWKVNGVNEGSTPSFGTAIKAMSEMSRFRPPSQSSLDKVFPVMPLDWGRLREPDQSRKMQVTWLGHASLLVQIKGFNILCDPVLSERCSPFQWIGPKRYRPAPCLVAELGQLTLDAVLISHNHYDHLDYETVRAIHQMSPATPFVVPLGLTAWFRTHVGPDVVLYELDWHESMELGKSSTTNVGTSGERPRDVVSNAEVNKEKNASDNPATLRVTSIPMRHWSNRTGNRDETLWCGYSLVGSQETSDNSSSSSSSFLFPGDTAWFDGLHDIVGESYGPWDVAALPIGAYEPQDFMKFYHMNVSEAVAMKDAVGATHAVPIHWGTFPLTTEPVMEPKEQLVELMQGRSDRDSFLPWLIGETRQF